MPRILIAFVLAAVACGGEELSTGQRLGPITDGVLDSGHPAVARLELTLPCPDDPSMDCSSLCTATLVGQRTLLTAAHCLEDTTGITAFLEGAPYTAASWVYHPGYSEKPLPEGYPYPNFANQLQFDIGVVRLQSAPPITPRSLAAAMPAVGARVTLVGHGLTAIDEVSPDYAKRVAYNTISAIASHEIFIEGSGDGEGSTCSGDSGGPAFYESQGVDVVYGVTSWGHPDSCEIVSAHSRVDVALDWIEQAAGGDVTVEGRTPPVPQDTTAPLVQILTPIPNASTGQSVTVTANITDDGELGEVTLWIDGTITSVVHASPFTFEAQLAPGPHTLQIVARDAVGNEGEASVNVLATSQPPSASLGGNAPTSQDIIQGGCSVAAHTSGVGLPILLALALIYCRKKASAPSPRRQRQSRS